LAPHALSHLPLVVLQLFWPAHTTHPMPLWPHAPTVSPATHVPPLQQPAAQGV
jgi:hypothetical protein